MRLGYFTMPRVNATIGAPKVNAAE